MSEAEMIECPTCFTVIDVELLIPAGDAKICPHCRDEYLQRIKEGISTNQFSEWVAIREEHIKHEASLRSVGLLFYLAAFFMLLGGLSMAVTTVLSAIDETGTMPYFVGLIVFYLLVGIILILVGRGYRKLKSWIRIPGTIFAVLGLLVGFPIGTLINAYILYLLHATKGRLILSAEYAEICDATPEVVYRTPLASWIFLITLVVLLFGLIGYFSMQ